VWDDEQQHVTQITTELRSDVDSDVVILAVQMPKLQRPKYFLPDCARQIPFVASGISASCL
jgi:hypothetical protein